MKKCICILIIAITVLFIACPLFAQDSTIVVSPDLELIKLTDETYIHVSYMESDGRRIPANGLVYIVDNHALIVDTPWTNELMDSLIDWLHNTLRTTVTAVVATHWHNDCLGGLIAAKKRAITTYGHVLTYRIGEEKGIEAPNVLFGNKKQVKIGSAFFECAYYGGGHTIDNIVVWLPRENILFGGCMIKAMNAADLGNIEDAVLEDWPATVRAVREAYPDAKIVVPGHGSYGGPELFDHTLELLEQHEQ